MYEDLQGGTNSGIFCHYLHSTEYYKECMKTANEGSQSSSRIGQNNVSKSPPNSNSICIDAVSTDSLCNEEREERKHLHG